MGERPVAVRAGRSPNRIASNRFNELPSDGHLLASVFPDERRHEVPTRLA